MALRSFTEKFELPGPVEKVFHYFTDTEQLRHSLPPSLKLRLIRRSGRHLKQGSSIEFQARILRLPIRCKSYVHSFSPNRHIAYICQKGMLASWEHDFYFEALPHRQTRVTECLLYHPPFGLLGALADRLWIRPYLKHLFQFRRNRLTHIFKEFQDQNAPSSPPASKTAKNHQTEIRPKP